MPFGTIGRTFPGMRQVVGFGDRSTGRGTLGQIWGAPLSFREYVCYSAATRSSSQITLDRLVIVVVIIIAVKISLTQTRLVDVDLLLETAQ